MITSSVWRFTAQLLDCSNQYKPDIARGYSLPSNLNKSKIKINQNFWTTIYKCLQYCDFFPNIFYAWDLFTQNAKILHTNLYDFSNGNDLLLILSFERMLGLDSNSTRAVCKNHHRQSSLVLKSNINQIILCIFYDTKPVSL